MFRFDQFRAIAIGKIKQLSIWIDMETLTANDDCPCVLEVYPIARFARFTTQLRGETATIDDAIDWDLRARQLSCANRS